MEQPTVVILGEETIPIMPPAADSIVAALPSARIATIPASNHGWEPQAMTAEHSTDDVHVALAEFDRCFAAGEADALAELFAVDAQLLLQHLDAIEGRSAIRAHWRQVFAAYDPRAWRTEQQIVEVHGDHAYVLSVYSETMVHRQGGPLLVVSGRLILFLRRNLGGPWYVTTAMNSHVRPVEQVT